VAQSGRSLPREAAVRRRQPGNRRSSIFALARGYLAESMVRNSAFLLINLGVTAFCSYAALSLLTHLYSVEAVGISAAAISASSLVVVLTQSGINYSLPRLLPTSKNRDAVINTILTSVFVASLIGSIIFLVTPFADKMFALGGLVFAVIFIASTCLQACSSLLGVVLIADRESGKMASANLVPNAVKLAAPPVFTFLGSLGAFIARVAYNIFYFFILVFMLIRRGHRFKFELSGEAAHELGRFSVGMYLATIVGGLPQMLLPIVVLSRMGAQQSAYWSIAMTIGILLYQLPSSVTQALLPEISHRPAERKRLLLRSTLLVTGIMVPSLVVAYVAAPFLLSFFGHSYTTGVISSLRWLIYAGFVTMMNYATGAILFLAKKSGAITFVNMVDAIIVVGLAAVWATSSKDVAIAYFIGDVGNTVLFGFFALVALHEVGGRFEALGGDQIPSAAEAARGPSSGSLQEAFDLLSSIAEQQRLATAREVARHNLTQPQGLYSILALQQEEATYQRQRQRRAERQLKQPQPPGLHRPQPRRVPRQPQHGGGKPRDDDP
jgi:O-antigen/teichoic acid export membrane protein